MAKLTLSTKNPTAIKVKALIVGTHPTSDGVAVVGGDLARDVIHQVESLAPILNITGESGDVKIIPAGPSLKADVLVLVGLGSRTHTGQFTSEQLRRAAGAAVRSQHSTESIAIALPVDTEADLMAVAEGALLGAYQFTRYRAPSSQGLGSITILAKSARGAVAQRVTARATIVADAVNATRDLVNTGPNDLYPAAFAEAAQTAAKGTGVKVSVLDEKQLVAGGYGGIIAVGQGSARGPRLVKLSYSPSKAQQRIALVGKGITFDSGGISIKPAQGMEAMKSDMAGAAAVLHTVLAVARLGLPIAVTGWCALAENMPSGTAQRPSDVITMRGGKTVEVLNTDAEGRLVLGDALVAARDEALDAILDVATLTGAQMIALGSRVSAVMGTDGIRDAVVAAGEVSGEQFWAMPLPEELRASLKSSIADLANIGDRFGGMLVAGLFLREFVGDVPWAHLDIAGPALNEGSARDYTPPGGTGVAVRTLISFLEQRAAQK